MKWILNLFRSKPKQRPYPVADPKRIAYKPTSNTLCVLIFLAVAVGCATQKGTLPNGCTYKLKAPKFTK